MVKRNAVRINTRGVNYTGNVSPEMKLNLSEAGPGFEVRFQIPVPGLGSFR